MSWDWRAAAPTEPAIDGSPVTGGSGLGGGLLAGGGGRRGAVAGRDEGDLVAEPGQGLLVVADEVLAVSAIPLLVVVPAGLGVILPAAGDRSCDADQGMGDRGRDAWHARWSG